ncbi:hypothetical protein PLANPX_0662 [Lacipirellula parvula]|uniref:Class I SAM-dependent methyltransferase n=2 Tax=Lacipirellula parvula TaxID=2650471 RepID=A0A5K7X3G3_9BACT|nr:hypothetical protein PLANPX_0662 [Lacipirellula parvula]
MNAEYWRQRAQFRYYKIVRHLLEDHGPGELIIDVGGGSTPVATYGHFRERLSIDQDVTPSIEGVRSVRSDWMEFTPARPASVVLCLQVLEHLEDELVRPFAEKLFSSGRLVIISVPYKWDRNKCRHHKQDPIDERKLHRITGRQPLESLVVTERPNRAGSRRLIAVYEGDA